MFVFKKMLLAVLSLGSGLLSAGTMGPVCSPGDVSVPCVHSSWNVAAQALYLQTTFNQTFSYYPRGDNGIYSSLAGQWGWGFKLEGAYHFNTGNDLTVNWYHLDGRNAHLNFNPFGEFDLLNPLTSLNLSLTLKNQWDAVNGELGQFVDLSRDVKYRIHGGFQFARIKNTMNARVAFITPEVFLGLFPEQNAPSQLSYNSDFNGFGPRTGIDMNYVLGKGFSMYAKAATALLVGTAKQSASGLAAPLTRVYGSRTVIVPELEASVGLDYNYSTSRGDFIFDLGYLWANYFKPFANQNIFDNLQNNQSFVPQNKTTDLGISGLYFGLKYVANV